MSSFETDDNDKRGPEEEELKKERQGKPSQVVS